MRSSPFPACPPSQWETHRVSNRSQHHRLQLRCKRLVGWLSLQAPALRERGSQPTQSANFHHFCPGQVCVRLGRWIPSPFLPRQHPVPASHSFTARQSQSTESSQVDTNGLPRLYQMSLLIRTAQLVQQNSPSVQSPPAGRRAPPASPAPQHYHPSLLWSTSCSGSWTLAAPVPSRV